MKFHPKTFFCALFTFYVLHFTYYIKPALAQTTKAWTGRCVANGDIATIQGLECMFENIVSVIILFAGLAFFGMFIYGGFQYLTSEGDDKRVAAAQSILTMAITGLVGAVASYLIFNFIQTFTGANVTNFIIPGP